MPQNEEQHSEPLTRADLDRAVETIVGELAKCATREDLTATNARLDRVENHLDRLSASMQLIQAALTITNRWADNLDKTVRDEIAGLNRRVEALERKAS